MLAELDNSSLDTQRAKTSKDTLTSITSSGDLATELGNTHQAIKTVMRWTGASERSVKHRFAGTHAPSRPHRISLMQHSDTALACILQAAWPSDLEIGLGVVALRLKLRKLLSIIDDQFDQETEPIEPPDILPVKPN